MLLTIGTTHRPATDLGFLLHKNPARPQSFSLSFGQAHVFYPEVGGERRAAALQLDVDPVGLVRGKGGQGGALDGYVNDRPYVASSFLSVALVEVFHSAMDGAGKERPELAERLILLEAWLAVVPCRGGESMLRRLFEPLGYAVGGGGPTRRAFPRLGRERLLHRRAGEPDTVDRDRPRRLWRPALQHHRRLPPITAGICKLAARR